MRFQLTTLLTVFSAGLAVASWPAELEWLHKKGQGPAAPDHTSPRPSVSCLPKKPHRPVPSHPLRTRVCYVKSHGNGNDDASYVLDAIRSCNNGGHVVFKQGIQYTIGTALDLTFLKHIDIGILQFHLPPEVL